MAGEWVLKSGTWGCSSEGNFDLQKSGQGNPVSSLLISDDVDQLSRVSYLDVPGRRRTFPPEFLFSPDTGKALTRAMSGERTEWMAPFGHAQIRAQQAPGASGLRQTSSPLLVANLRGRKPEEDADATMELPPPGNYQFLSASFGAAISTLIAVDPAKGTLFLRAPASRKWQELREGEGALLAECGLAPIAWRAESAQPPDDGFDSVLFLPSDQGLVVLKPDVISLSYAAAYVGEGTAISGPIYFQEQIWLPLRLSDGSIEFVSADATGKPGQVLPFSLPHALSDFGSPVSYGRNAVWPCKQGQLCLQKQTNGSVAATFIAWCQGVAPEFEFGCPYLAKDGGLWQLCFDATQGNYVYARLAINTVEYETTSSPRLSSGNINYRFTHKHESNPWIEPEQGDDSSTNAFIVPLLESTTRKVVAGIMIESSSGLANVLQGTDRQRARLCLDDNQAITPFYTYVAAQPWLSRLFIHDGMLWLYHAQLNAIHGWRLE